MSYNMGDQWAERKNKSRSESESTWDRFSQQMPTICTVLVLGLSSLGLTSEINKTVSISSSIKKLN